MTKTIEINVPKPGDSLPFEVLRWEDEISLAYEHHTYPKECAVLCVHEYSFNEEFRDGFVDACSMLLGIPQRLEIENGVIAEPAVAEVTE